MKKGLSGILAIVLVIILTILVVAIVWKIILPIVKSNFSKDVVVSVVMENGYTVYDSSNGLASVQIKRENGQLTGIRVIFIVNGSIIPEFKISENDLPEIGSTKMYKFNLSGYGRPEDVRVYPV